MSEKISTGLVQELSLTCRTLHHRSDFGAGKSHTSLLHSYVGKLALVMGLNGCFKNTLGRVFIFCMAVNGTNVALPPIQIEPYAETTPTSAKTTLLLVCVYYFTAPQAQRRNTIFPFPRYMCCMQCAYIMVRKRGEENSCKWGHPKMLTFSLDITTPISGGGNTNYITLNADGEGNERPTAVQLWKAPMNFSYKHILQYFTFNYESLEGQYMP